MKDLKPGQLVDIYNSILGEWQEEYGVLQYFDERDSKWVYETTKYAHDGCKWCYGAKPEHVRESKNELA